MADRPDPLPPCSRACHFFFSSRWIVNGFLFVLCLAIVAIYWVVSPHQLFFSKYFPIIFSIYYVLAFSGGMAYCKFVRTPPWLSDMGVVCCRSEWAARWFEPLHHLLSAYFHSNLVFGLLVHCADLWEPAVQRFLRNRDATEIVIIETTPFICYLATCLTWWFLKNYVGLRFEEAVADAQQPPQQSKL